MRVYTDAARDDDVAGMGWIIELDGQTLNGRRFMLGNYTSMEAEYFAMMDGLRFAKRESTEQVQVYVDCEPLVTKMRVPSDDDTWYERRRGCHRLLHKFDDWEMEWTPRSSNSEADRLAYEALENGRRNI